MDKDDLHLPPNVLETLDAEAIQELPHAPLYR